MTYIRKHRLLALLACAAMLAFVFGCHGAAPSQSSSSFSGSWNGSDVEVSSSLGSRHTLHNTALQLGNGTDSSAVGTAQAGDPAQLWANVDGEGGIHYVGTVVQTGNNLVINLAPNGVNGAGVDVDAMILLLQGDGVKQELTGTLTWTRGGEEFTGLTTFVRFD